jgi:diguanylate cyclase (GGDEF)-like protein
VGAGRSSRQAWRAVGRRLVRTAPLGLLWAGAAAFGWSVFAVDRGDAEYHSLWDGWVANGIYVGTGLAVLLRAATTAGRRRGAVLVGAGLLVSSTGDLLYLFHDQNLDPIPFPAPSDVGWLLSYPILIAGLVMLVGGGRRAPAGIRIDGLIVATAAAAAAAPFVLEPTLVVSGTPLAAATGLAYPLLDMLMLVLLVATVVAHRVRVTGQQAWLAAAVVTWAGGDILFLKATAEGTYVLGTPLDLTWIAGSVCFATAVWCTPAPGAPSQSTRSGTGRGLTLLPVVGATVALVVPALQVFTDVPSSATALAVLAIAAVLVRLLVTLREERRLLSSHQMARTDDLTGIPNRRGFLEELERWCGRDGTSFAVLLFDLDRFKEINDTLGHAAGDHLLRSVSGRAASEAGTSTFFARLGGDEFAALVPAQSDEEAMAAAERFNRAFQQPVMLDGVPVRVGSSCGVARAPAHGGSRGELLRAADVAMYKAKRERHGRAVVYDEESDPHRRDRLELVEELRHALRAGAFEPHYQPLLSLGSGRVVAVEALARWRHPERGLLAPAVFLPLLEQAGLLPLLTRVMVDRAVADAACAAGDWNVSVNVTAQDLMDDALCDVIQEALDFYGLPARRLTLEITEDAVVRDADRARRLLAPLRAMGVRVAVDDFGTGYQSLAQLLALDIDEVKLDRSIISEVVDDIRSQAVVRAMASLARSLGIVLVAEGVEDEDALACLGELGCTVAQGFVLAYPVAARDLDPLVVRLEAGHLRATPVVRRDEGMPSR